MSPGSLTIKRLKNIKNAITVTVTGEADCKVKGEKVTAKVKVDPAGKKLISVTPASRRTKADGTASFSINAKRKTGAAAGTFNTGDGSTESLSVTVTK